MPDQSGGGMLSHWLKVRRLKRVAPFVHGAILDYGCGTGGLLPLVRPESYTGFDVDEYSLSVARAIHPEHLFISDLQRVIRAGKQFDVIVMAAVIEHVESPRDTLASLKPLLAASGVFVITTPHPRWRRMHDLGARMGIFSMEASHEHKSFLDLVKVSELADQLGLVVLKATRFLMGANQLFVLGRAP